MTDKILFERVGDWGVITLNNQRALNALDWGMAKAMRAKMSAWKDDPTIKAVLIKANGDKAFCAGGDVRWLYENGRDDPVGVCEFFRDEYTNNALIYHFPKPYVALIDGIVMGGGVGLSIHGDYRIAGDATLFAMPETAIGLFPDIGGGYFLPRLKPGLGLYLGLTGARVRAADCVSADIASHYAPSERHNALEHALVTTRLGDDAHGDIEAVLKNFAEAPGDPTLVNIEGEIMEIFDGVGSLDELFDRLNTIGSEFARSTRQTLQGMSPTSMAITFEQLMRGLNLDFNAVMRMEFRMVRRVMEGHDFYEGVRAQIIEKDRQPKWKPDQITGVSGDDVSCYFEPLGDDELELS